MCVLGRDRRSEERVFFSYSLVSDETAPGVYPSPTRMGHCEQIPQIGGTGAVSPAPNLTHVYCCRLTPILAKGRPHYRRGYPKTHLQL